MSPLLRRVVGCLLSLVMLLGVGVAFPQTPLDVDVALYYDAGWQDITSYVYHRDKISITRGFSANGKNCDPGKLKLTLNNRDGRFSPRNPSSPLFGKIGRNTPIRVQVTDNAVTYTRFIGEVTSWPSKWDVSEKDIWVPLEAAGILRRLNKGEKPVRSPLHRAVTALGPDFYWPMEEGNSATRFASALPGQTALTITPIPSDLSIDELVPGSQALPSFTTYGAFAFGSYTDTGQWTLHYVFRGEGSSYATLQLQTAALQITISITGVANLLTVNLHDRATDSTIANHTDAAPAAQVKGPPVSITVTLINDESGSSDGILVRLRDGDGNLISEVDQLVGVGYYGQPQSGLLNFAGAEGTYGHVALFSDPTFISGGADVTAAVAMGAYDGFTADDRFALLCVQTSTPYAVTGTSSARMGPERPLTLVQGLQSAADVDQALLFELRDQLGVQMRTLSSLYNQIPVQLDYGAGHISPPFEPEPDDQRVANDREVKRRNGSSARRELPSGPLSVLDPPAGVGRYDDTITIDAYSDSQLDNIAGWRLHDGTWDAERYPAVRVNLAAAPGMIAELMQIDTGDLMTVDNLPSWLPPGLAELAVAGYAEKLGLHEWEITYACWPGGPYNVVGGWGLLAHELHTAMNSAVTSADIATTNVAQPLLATSGFGSGHSVTIGGEELQVTAVAASTITYGAVGTVAHASNASVTPALPASVAAGNLLLCLAAIRNSGTGVPQAPTGYTRLAVFPATANVQLFAKIAGGSETDPTVTFTGGVANADTTAQIIRLAGKWHDVANIIPPGGTASRLNASAQDITYPGLSKPRADDCIILYLAWKQDDWTSVASPGTEIGEPDTTTGDDQGVVWSYAIQTTAAAIPSGTFVVTGGSTAISRAAVVALRCDYQTATVTRSVNGISASHSAGDDVTATRPMRWGLI